MKIKQAVILGAGITSLSIARRLQKSEYKVTVIEKTGKVGGVCATFKHKDYLLDYGPHKFYTQLPGVYEEFKEVVGEGNYLTVVKKNSIRLQGKYFKFPVKITQLVTGIKPTVAAKIGLDFGTNFVKNIFKKDEVETFEDYFVKGFGRKGFDILFGQYARKVWGDPSNLTADLARRRVPVGSIFDVLKNAIKPSGADVSAETFLYPKYGYGMMCDSLAETITKNGGQIIFNSSVEEIIIGNTNNKSTNSENSSKIVEEIFYRTKVDGKAEGKREKIICDVLISSIPINDLPQLILPKPSSVVIDSAKSLKFRALVICYVFVNKERCLDDNWIFFPEKEFCFNRVSEQKSFSEFMIPKDKTVLMAEITCDYGDETYNSTDEEIKELVLKDLEKAGLVKKGEVIEFFTRKAGRVYPIYTLDYKEKLITVHNYLDNISNIFTVGRLGLYNYNNADHCIDMARVVAETIINDAEKADSNRTEWKKAREYFDNYRIVD